MKQTSLHILLLTAVSVVIFFTSLGGVRLWDRDEPRNAGCAIEMMQRGDMVVPIFNSELRYQKPAMLYWLMISAYQVFGVSEFAARFWSAVLGTGSVVLTYLIARRLFDTTTALLAGLVLCSSMMFCVAARAATPDSVLIFFSTLALAIYTFGVFDPKKIGLQKTWMPNRLACVAMYAVMGLAVLTKGPIGFLIPTAIIGMFLLVVRLPESEKTNPTSRLSRFRQQVLSLLRPLHPVHFLKTCGAMRLGIASVVVLFIAAPWYTLCHLQTDGDFTRIFFLSENFGRATNSFENHGGGIWYYPVAIIAGFFPWSIFLVPVMLILRTEFLKRPKSTQAPFVFLLCWVGVQVGLFSLASTKLPSYVTPCYPALAILTAFALKIWATESVKEVSSFANAWFYAAFATAAATGIAITAGLYFVGTEYLAGDITLSVLGCIPIVGAVAAMYFTLASKRQSALVTYTCTAIIFGVAFFGFGTARVDDARDSDKVLASLSDENQQVTLASYGCLESSWVYYSGGPIYELSFTPHNASTESHTLNAVRKSWKPKPRCSPEAFAAHHPDAVYITTDEHIDSLLERLPEHYSISESSEFFLKKNRKLLLVGPDTIGEKRIRTAMHVQDRPNR